MSGHDPLRKALLESFDRIALVQSPERRSRLEGTAAGGADGVTPCAMGAKALPRSTFCAWAGQKQTRSARRLRGTILDMGFSAQDSVAFQAV